MGIDVGPIELERDTVLEIVAAVVPVALMIAALAMIGTTYDSSETLPPDGGIAVLGAIAVFVVVMSAVGLLLSWLKSGDDDGDDGEAPDGDGAEAANG